MEKVKVFVYVCKDCNEELDYVHERLVLKCGVCGREFEEDKEFVKV